MKSNSAHYKNGFESKSTRARIINTILYDIQKYNEKPSIN